MAFAVTFTREIAVCLSTAKTRKKPARNFTWI